VPGAAKATPAMSTNPAVNVVSLFIMLHLPARQRGKGGASASRAQIVESGSLRQPRFPPVL